MSDSTTLLAQIESSQAAKEVTANGLFDAVSPASSYGRRAEACSGLTWAYYGTRYGSAGAIANGTYTCVATQTTYMMVELATGIVQFSNEGSDSDPNWDDPLYGRAYIITTNGSTVTGYEDHRFGPRGIVSLAGVGDVISSAVADVSPIGRHAVWISAAAITPSASGGCAALATIASAANQPDIQSLDFDASTQEYAQFSLTMPKSWNESTVTFVPVWSHAATTTNFGVVWSLQGLAVGNDDAIAQNYGTAQTSTDTGGTTDDLYHGPESSAITIAGSPASEDTVFFRLSRVTGDGGDTMAVDARLHGIVLYITTNAGNDA